MKQARALVLPAPQARPGRTRRNLPREQWYERIVETARILGEEHGDDALTADLVAKAAGLSRAHLYTFFPRRGDILRAVVEARAERFSRRLLDDLGDVTQLDDRIQRIVERTYALVAAAGTADAGRATRGNGMGELMQTYRRRVAPAVGVELIGSGGSNGHHAHAPELIGHVVMAMAEGAAVAAADLGQHERRASQDAAVTLIREVIPVVVSARRGAAGSLEGTAPQAAR